MIQVGCFSYKGGAGRTTSAANLAVGLAKKGKRVLCIDLDFEAPGLHHIFGLSHHVGRLSTSQDFVSAHSILGGMTPAEEAHKGFIDIGKHSSLPLLATLNDRLFLLPGNPHNWPIVPYDDQISEYLWETLQEGLEKGHYEQGLFDYLIIDSASGVGPRSLFSYLIADIHLYFFRWTRQHVYGVHNLVNRVQQHRSGSQYDSMQLGDKIMHLIACAVPSDTELEEVIDQDLALEIHNSSKEYADLLGTLGFEGEISCKIPEYSVLKWQETLGVLYDGFDAYDNLVDLILPNG